MDTTSNRREFQNDEVKILWFEAIQCDHIIEARRPYIGVNEKKAKICTIIDIAVLGDCRIDDQEVQKEEKYQDLKWEVIRLWT